ncbi:MAG: hypothetical protein BMS9Abin05_1745 [Rhodothermia bacterium]|nr:MAG: hypothetical protein BMS9Abin05_1745 [Rhodothermia bacterium]
MQKAFKRWMKATAILFAVMLIGANTGLAQVTVSLGEITGRPGESATVAVNISGVESGTAIKSFDFQVIWDAGVTFTGVSSTGTLSGNAEFATGVNGGLVGSFSTAPVGTDITTSGVLINLNFDLDAESTGTVTLTSVRFNAGDPAVAGGNPSTNFTVATRIVSVSIEHDTRLGEAYTNTGQPFKILVTVEDALVEGDGVVSFNFTLHYDPAFLTIDTGKGFGGASTDGGVANFSVVNANDDGNGTMLVGGFTLNNIVGSGTLVTIFATAGAAAGTPPLSLSDVVFNAGVPIYAPRGGVALILPFNVASEEEPGLPSEFALKGNYPNPFNPSTTIQFDLPESSDVSITVMDLLGRQVLFVPTRSMSAGTNRSIQIDANTLSSGIYLYRVIAQNRANTNVKVGTMTLLK